MKPNHHFRGIGTTHDGVLEFANGLAVEMSADAVAQLFSARCKNGHAMWSLCAANVGCMCDIRERRRCLSLST